MLAYLPYFTFTKIFRENRRGGSIRRAMKGLSQQGNRQNVTRGQVETCPLVMGLCPALGQSSDEPEGHPSHLVSDTCGMRRCTPRVGTAPVAQRPRRALGSSGTAFSIFLPSHAQDAGNDRAPLESGLTA